MNNSTRTYNEIRSTLSPARAEVFSAVVRAQTSTRQSIAAALDWPINRVTGRVTELINAGVVVERGVSRISKYPRAILVAVGVK
jgi:predicted transcriptional regulator